MSQLGKRLISSAFFISISVSTIFWAPLWVFVLVVEILTLLTMNEFFEITAKKGILVNRPAGLLICAAVPVAVYFDIGFLILIVACLAFFVLNFHKDQLKTALVSTAVNMLGLIYIAWFFSRLIELRMLDYGAQWVFYVALIVKGGDAGAYFIGSKYGKNKLIEHVSPKKSVEGAVGGLVTCVLLSLFSKSYLPEMPVVHLLILGMFASVISQVGDLAESMIKRDVGVKDSGQIPGLGGVLDVLDSLLPTIPFVYYYVIKFA